METTLSGSMETHQDIYEWWRNKKDEIVNSIEDVRSSGTVDNEVLDLMKDLLGKTKLKKVSLGEYLKREEKLNAR